MVKTTSTRYDVAEHLRTPEEMAAYLEACFEEANGDASFIAKALGLATSLAPKVCLKLLGMQGCPGKASTKHFPVNVSPASIPF
jgi:hypothetical protein